jgi:dTDP-D-glucose 4,6-dehydratase
MLQTIDVIPCAARSSSVVSYVGSQQGVYAGAGGAASACDSMWRSIMAQIRRYVASAASTRSGLAACTTKANVVYEQPINLGTSDERRINELVALIEQVLGRPLRVQHRPLPGDDPKQRRPDTTLAREMLDWRPTVGLREGLRKTLMYFRADRRWKRHESPRGG